MKTKLHILLIGFAFIGSNLMAQIDIPREEMVTLFREGRYWGIVNLKGEVLLKPKFARVTSFKNGFSKVSLFKFVNKKGEILDVKKYLKRTVLVGQFSDGLLMVKILGKWGYMNVEGELVVPAIYKEVTDFVNGVAFVKNKNGSFVIDKEGNEKQVVSERKISELRNFSDGLAGIMTGGRTNNRLGYINIEGEIIIKPQYVHCGDFKNGIAWVVTEDGKNGFINKKGEWAIESKFIRVKDLDSISGMARIRDKEGWGYTNLKGEILRPENMKIFRDFSEGFCKVLIDKKWGFMNNKGEIVIEPKFDSKSYKKITKLKFDPLLMMMSVAGAGSYYSKTIENNTRMLFKEFDNDGVTQFTNGYANVRLDGKWGVIDEKGNWVLQPIYDWLMPFGEIY